MGGQRKKRRENVWIGTDMAEWEKERLGQCQGLGKSDLYTTNQHFLIIINITTIMQTKEKETEGENLNKTWRGDKSNVLSFWF